MGTQTRTFIAGISGVTAAGTAVPVLIDTKGQLGTISSSRRFKEEIQDMGEASSRIMQLRPVTFRYKKENGDGARPLQFGLIAEEVTEVYPGLVQYSATDYPHMSTLLWTPFRSLYAPAGTPFLFSRRISTGTLPVPRRHPCPHPRPIESETVSLLGGYLGDFKGCFGIKPFLPNCPRLTIS